MIYYVSLDADNLITGIFTSDHNGEEFCNALDPLTTIRIDEDLFQHVCLLPGQKQYTGFIGNEMLTLMEKEQFSSFIGNTPQVPSLEDRINILEDIALLLL